MVSPTKASLDSSRVLRTGPGSSGQDSSRQGTARAAPTTKVERKARERAGDMGPNGLTLRDSTRHLPANYREETIANSKLVSEKTKLKERAELAEAALEPTAAKVHAQPCLSSEPEGRRAPVSRATLQCLLMLATHSTITLVAASALLLCMYRFRCAAAASTAIAALHYLWGHGIAYRPCHPSPHALTQCRAPIAGEAAAV